MLLDGHFHRHGDIAHEHGRCREIGNAEAARAERIDYLVLEIRFWRPQAGADGKIVVHLKVYYLNQIMLLAQR